MEIGRNREELKPARTRRHESPDASRDTKSDAAEAAVPPGHDGARQALSELRRMIDPERDRFGDLLPARHDVADKRRDLKRHRAIKARHHHRRTVASAFMAAALFLGARVLMLEAILMAQHRVRIDLMSVAAQY